MMSMMARIESIATMKAWADSEIMIYGAIKAWKSKIKIKLSKSKYCALNVSFDLLIDNSIDLKLTI